MKKLILSTIIFIGLCIAAGAQTDNKPDLLVDIPKVPERIERLDERCNYMMMKFWERANLKSVFSSPDKLDATFGQFLAYAPYATADTVRLAIDNLIKGIEKADAKNLAKLGALAEKWCGHDTCEYASEELMMMFADGISKSKKFKGPEKARYQAMAKRLSNSRTGAIPGDFEFFYPDGTKGKFSDIESSSYLLFFYEPDCIDCRLGRTRLGQHYVIKTLQNHNLLKVIAIYPNEPDDQWKADIEAMPDNWIIVSSPDIDELFTITHSPEIYYLDKDRRIESKGFSVNTAIRYFDQFLNPQNAQPAAQ